MSKTDRDRLVAGRENRGFSYTEESADGEEGKDESRHRPSVRPRPFIMYPLSGEGNMSPRTSRASFLSPRILTARRRPSFSEEWHQLNGA